MTRWLILIACVAITWLTAPVRVSSEQEPSANELTLHFPEGVHDVSSRVLSEPRVVISGDSQKMPILRCSRHDFKSWQDYFIFGIGKGVKHVEFRNLILELSNRQTCVAAILPDIDHDATLSFEDCVFRFTGEADPLPDQSDELKPPCAITIGARMRQCRFVRCTTSNMMLLNAVCRAGYADTVLAQGCRFESPHGHLRVKHGNLVANGCTFAGSRNQAGLDLYVGRARITNCVFSDDAASIRLSDVAPAVLMGCRFQGKSKRPVLVERRSHALIVDSAMGEEQQLTCDRKYGNAVALNCDMRRGNPLCRYEQFRPEDLRLITAADFGSTGEEKTSLLARLLDLTGALPEILYVDRIRSILAEELVARYDEGEWERLCCLGVNRHTVDEWLLLVEEVLDKEPECAKKLISPRVARLVAQKLRLPVFQNHLFPGLLAMMRGGHLQDRGEALLAQDALPDGYRDQIESIMISNSEGDHACGAWGNRERIGPWACNAVFRRLKKSNDLRKLRALAERFPDSPIARHISAHIFQHEYTRDVSAGERLRKLRRETLEHRYAVCAIGRFDDGQLRKFSDFYGTNDVFVFRKIEDLAEGSDALKQACAKGGWDILWVLLPCADMSKRTHDFFRDLARGMDSDPFLDFVPAYLPCAHERELPEFLENLIRAEGEAFKDQFSASYVQGMTYAGYPDPVCADLDHPVCRLSAVLNPSPLAESCWWCGSVLSRICGRDALLLIDHGDASGGDAVNIRTFRDLPEGALHGSLVVSSYCHGAGMLNPIQRMVMGWRDAHGFSHACLKKGAIAFYGGLSYNFGPTRTPCSWTVSMEGLPYWRDTARPWTETSFSSETIMGALAGSRLLASITFCAATRDGG